MLGTIPIAILGVAFKHKIEHEFRTLELIGTMLIVMGLVLLAADATSRRERELERPHDARRLDHRLRPGAALVPGVSRSGATITAGLVLGFDRESAARYSFLL